MSEVTVTHFCKISDTDLIFFRTSSIILLLEDSPPCVFPFLSPTAFLVFCMLYFSVSCVSMLCFGCIFCICVCICISCVVYFVFSPCCVSRLCCGRLFCQVVWLCAECFSNRADQGMGRQTDPTDLETNFEF